jgi:methionyl-tRNA formyltransferase
LLRTAELLHASGLEIPLVWTCPAQRHYGAEAEDFSNFARKCGATFIVNRRMDAAGCQQELERCGAQLAVSVNWPTVIPAEVIHKFPLGILNAHAGDLPRYRGNACPNWALLQGEPFVGLCIHRMAVSIDTGPVVCRDRFPLGPDTYIGEVYDWLEARTPALFLKAVRGLCGGDLEPEPQSEDASSILHCYPRRPEDSCIKWSSPVEGVYRLIRASSRPFSGAYTTLEGTRKVTVWRAQPSAHRGAFLAVPGQVAYRMGNDPVIGCLDGMIRLTEVEIEGIVDPGHALREIHRSLRHRLG